MKCYGQLWYESGSYAAPQADDYSEWDSIEAAKSALAGTWGDFDVAPADGQGVTLLLWMGTPDPDLMFPCDGLPDRSYELGPRGGVRLSY